MSLLDYLAAKVGARYLSDLRFPVYQLPLCHVLRRIEIEAFDLAEWNEAVCYITGEQRNFIEITEAVKYLMQSVDQCVFSIKFGD